MKRNNYVFIFLLITDFIGFLLIINNFLECSIVKWLLVTLFIFLPKILKFKISINETLELLYFILIFLSSLLGRVYNLYDNIVWYDTVVHFLSGIVCFIFGLMILKYFDSVNNFYFNILFCIIITMSLGVLWEFIELEFDYLFHTNMMKIPETGVMDTMKDLSVASLSSILSGFIYFCYNSIDTNDTL